MQSLKSAVRFRVSGGLEQAAWIFAPEQPNAVRAALVCLAGGTYDKRYWHMEIAGHPGYSFAEHMATLGYLVVALDHLGVGESSDPAGSSVGLELLVAGDCEVVDQIANRLRTGDLADGVGPLGAPIVGIGHSMGACITTMVQARQRPYGSVALLGYGVDVTNVRDEVTTEESMQERVEHSERALRQLSGADPQAAYHVVARDQLRTLFHAPSVPQAVIDADTAAQSRVPVRAAAEVTTPGFVAPFAEAIDVPLFLGFGAVLDTSPEPRMEPANYPVSPDITLYLLADAAHCHNFASTRTVLWNRIASWIASVI